MSFLPSSLQASDLAQSEIWCLFKKISYYSNSLLCVLKQNLASCCGAWDWCFHRLLLNWEPPKSPHKPVTQTAVMFFPPKPRGVCPGNGSSPHTATSAQQQAPLWWEPGLEQGGTWMHTEGVYQDILSLLPLMLSPNTLLQFLQAPTVVSRFNKAFIFPPP